jgi:hypothetical protein
VHLERAIPHIFAENSAPLKTLATAPARLTINRPPPKEKRSMAFESLRSFCSQLLAVILAGLMTIPAYGSALDSEQQTRLKAIQNKLSNGTATTDDMYEAGVHSRVATARLRDSGEESKVDSFIRNTANTNWLMNKCLQTKGATSTGCKTAISILRSNGVHTTILASAGVAFNADKWAHGLLITKNGMGRLLPVLLPAPSCAGAREAVDVTMIAGSVMVLFPAAQGAGAITLLFGGILLFAVDAWC